jgi:hypothetical protein
MRSLLTLLVVLSFTATVFAQNVKQQVISSAGGFDKSSDNSVSLSWTLGELVISNLKSVDNELILTQGFQQSKLLLTDVKTNQELGVTITVFPNPTSEFVNIRLETPLDEEAIIDLAGPDGHVILNDNILPGSLMMQINMLEYPGGTYILRIKNGIKQNVYKIIKL